MPLSTVNPNPSRVTTATWNKAVRIVNNTPYCVLGGIYVRKTGYHATRADNLASWPGSYSLRHTLDRNRGPADKGRATDYTFTDAQAGRYGTINTYFGRVYRAGKAFDPRTRGFVEVFGQLDSDGTVEGVNFRTGGDTTSEPSHLWHVHESESGECVGCWINADGFCSVWFAEARDAWYKRIGYPDWTGVPWQLGSLSGTVSVFQRWAGLAADGDFGGATDSFVRGFQSQQRLSVTGRIDAATWNTLRNLALVRDVQEGIDDMKIVHKVEGGVTTFAVVSANGWNEIVWKTADDEFSANSLAEVMGNSKLITDPKRFDRARSLIRGWGWGAAGVVDVDEDALAGKLLDRVDRDLPGMVGTGLASAVANAAPVIAEAVGDEIRNRMDS